MDTTLPGLCSVQWLVEGLKMYINLQDQKFQHHGCSNSTVIFNCKNNFVRYKSCSSCRCAKGDNALYNLVSFCGYVNNYKAKTTCKQRSQNRPSCNRCEQVLECPRSSKTAVSLTNELSNKSYQTATPFQFFTLGFLWVMAFAKLNITVGRANGIMPWLLMVTGTLYC